MSLIKCQECGNEVSTTAKTCPKCGAKVKTKKIGVIGWIGLSFIGFVVLAGINGKHDASPPNEPSPHDVAMEKVKLDKYNWTKDGFGNVMMLDATIKNSGAVDVKDVEITCTHYANSGTKIDSNKKTVFESVQAGKSKKITKFNMGFIHSQANSTSCEITNLVTL